MDPISLKKEEIKKEILRLQKAKEKAIQRRNSLKNDVNEYSEFIDKAQQKKRHIERSLEETYNRVKIKSSGISMYNKYVRDYNQKIKRTIFSSKSNRALNNLVSSINKAKRKIIETEDSIQHYSNLINQYSNQIATLKTQLNQLEVNQ